MKLRLAALTLFTLLGACRTSGDLTTENGGGVFLVRDSCPVVGVPTATGDITLFRPGGEADSRAIDLSAAITHVRGTCTQDGENYVSTVEFNVVALRNDPIGGRQVQLPYFDVALQAGEKVVAKRTGIAVLNFAPGSAKAWTHIKASVRVSRAAATLPAEARNALTRPRKSGDSDAAVDPLSDPAIRAQVASATFEHLVGFQLTQEQLRYNATR